jgi:hypothetical protein
MVLLLFLALTSGNFAATLTDNFNDNTLDSLLWSSFLTGGIGSVSETNQRLEVTITGNNDSAGATLRWLALGNFDFRASYTMLTNIDGFSTDQDESGAAVLAFTPEPIFAARFPGSVMDLPGPQGVYAGAEGDTLFYGYALTSDQSGRLRVTRVGNLYTAYYWGAGDWIALGSGTSTRTGPADLHLGAFADGDATVSAAFDDFYLEADGLSQVPEPGSFALAGIALGLICVIRKRRR